ncbi:integrase [Rhodoblastus acidophilus]|uniref:tyrosine-type recombinase/integrase n=1 Tax=Rhodoblastus acidophilus TaxID=1074 RepID=UPI0022241B3F|nr:site-specific integrase [Rhodoblastus acidophilus]MCW2286901.1 integrase [Rhodoblastus acidophilus]MCW2335762.1 integrase [Rhodoblastus acidophilus]
MYGIVEELIERLGENTPLSSIDAAKVQDLKMGLIQKGNSGARINRKMVYLKALLEHGKDRGALDEVPRFPKKEHEGEGRERFLTNDEVDLLFYFLSPKFRAFATFLLYTGARIGEATALPWVDIRGSSVTFRWTLTKGKKTRTIPLVDKAKEAVETYGDTEAPGPWSTIDYDSFHQAFTAAKRKAGLDEEEIVPHTLRHTCASWMAIRGVDIRRIQVWMGHQDVKTTLRYAKLLPDNLWTAAAALQNDGEGVDNTGGDLYPHAVPPVSQMCLNKGNSQQVNQGTKPR